MTEKQIRAALRTGRGRNKRAQDSVDQADRAIADLLRLVPTLDGITMEVAAEEVGISRNMAYKMIGKRRDR